MPAYRPALSALALLAAGCASTTTVVLEPAAPAPVCTPAQAALVVWAPRWRPEQKDVPAREQAAAAGLSDFFAESGCFARVEVRRAADLTPATLAPLRAQASAAGAKLVTIELLELGPTVRLLASPALLEGGTEVVLRVGDYAPPATAAPRAVNVHWRDGGAGVVKGVGSLPADLKAALRAALQPATPTP